MLFSMQVVIMVSHHVPLNSPAFSSHQVTPCPWNAPRGPCGESYSSIRDRPPGPGLNTALPVPVAPLGAIGLGSTFSSAVHVPANILMSFVISADGLAIIGGGLPFLSMAA